MGVFYAIICFCTLLSMILLIVGSRRVSPQPKVERGITWVGANGTLRSAVELLRTQIPVSFIPVWQTPQALESWLPLMVVAPLVFATRRHSIRIGITPDALLYAGRAIPWGEVRSATFSYPKKGWLVATEKNGELLVPTLLSGLPALFEAFQKRGIPYQ